MARVPAVGSAVMGVEGDILAGHRLGEKIRFEGRLTKGFTATGQ